MQKQQGWSVLYQNRWKGWFEYSIKLTEYMTMGNAGPHNSNVPQDDNSVKSTNFILPSTNSFSPDDSKSLTDALPALPGAPAHQSPQLTLPATKGQAANPQQITVADLQPPQPSTIEGHHPQRRCLRERVRVARPIRLTDELRLDPFYRKH